MRGRRGGSAADPDFGLGHLLSGTGAAGLRISGASRSTLSGRSAPLEGRRLPIYGRGSLVRVPTRRAVVQFLVYGPSKTGAVG